MKKRQNRTELRQGCSRTQIFFSPSNYRTLRSNSDLEKDWFVECRFHSPEYLDRYPNGFQFRKRVNGYSTLSERKAAMTAYKEEMERMLDVMHYNPISKRYMTSDGTALGPYMDAATALDMARQKISGSAHHMKQIRCAITRVVEVFEKLGYGFLNISEIRLHHVKNALEYLDLPPYSFNKFRQYLSDVWVQLIQYGAADHNPCRDIIKKKITNQTPREIISEQELAVIDPYLEVNFPNFYRYRMIFGMSGGRSAELFRVQRKHVRLDAQEYTVQIQKGRSYEWETKVIILDALPYWKSLLDDGNHKDPDEFIFSVGLIPGPTQINSAQITRRWRRHVKNSTKIKDESGKIIKVTADFYTLKHKFIDELDALNDMQTDRLNNPAKLIASHKSGKMTEVYATGREARKREYLKNIKL